MAQLTPSLKKQRQRPRPRRRRMLRTILIVLGFVIIINFGLVWIVDIVIIVDNTNNHNDEGISLTSAGRRRLPDNNNIDSNRQAGEKLPQQQQQQQQQWPTMPPRESSSNTAGFIHVGKTAGSTISLLLRNGCTSFKQGPCRNISQESAISKYVEHYYHVPDFFRLPTTNHESYIISVRDVYDRTVSAFLYHHPANTQIYNDYLTQSAQQKYQNEIAYGCFPSLETFATLVNGRQTPDECNYPYRHNIVEISDCSALACAVLHGKVRKFQHLFFNYRNILYTKIPLSSIAQSTTVSQQQQQQQQQQQRPRKLYSLRQEFLWEDWTNLNVLFGQSPETVYIPKVNDTNANLRNVSKYKLPISRSISSKAKLLLCEALKLEYIAYFTILHKSINIQQSNNNDDFLKSQQIAQTNCPHLNIPSIIQQIQVQQEDYLTT